MKFRFSNPYWLWLSMLVIALDQVTKQLVLRHLDWYDVVPVMSNLNFTHLRNTGAAFSSFSHIPPWAFVVLGCAVSFGILVWLRRNLYGHQLIAVAMCLILGGAVGNVIDRVRHGYVVDFIDVYVGQWHYAAFNVADMAICAGAGLLILDMVLDWWRHSHKTATESKHGN